MKKSLRLILPMVLGIASLGVTTTVANAATKSSQYITSNPEYVRTKRAMYLGVYRKSGKTYRQVKVPKNTLLHIEGIVTADDKHGRLKYTVGLSKGVLHYAAAKKYRYQQKNLPFLKANFKPVKLKAPVRTRVLHVGTGFKENASRSDVVPTAGFYLTLDNYLQYYSQAAMLKNGLYNSVTLLATDAYRPTRSIKVSRVTVKGRTTTVDYPRAVKGIPGKRLSPRHYRLKIKALGTTGMIQTAPEDDTFAAYGDWQNYTVNGHAYFNGQMSYDGN